MISVIGIWISVLSQHPDSRETGYSNVLHTLMLAMREHGREKMIYERPHIGDIGDIGDFGNIHVKLRVLLVMREHGREKMIILKNGDGENLCDDFVDIHVEGVILAMREHGREKMMNHLI